HGERSVFGSVLGLGREAAYRFGGRCPSLGKPLEPCDETELHACVAVLQRFPCSIPRIMTIKAVCLIMLTPRSYRRNMVT
ncbi:MAG: hypothetical protein WAM44_02750, partial [Chthoniobacterales bacterium]